MVLEKCSYCGTNLTSEYSFCPYCGMPVIPKNTIAIETDDQVENLDSISFCSKCGHRLQDITAFCPSCGNKIIVTKGKAKIGIKSTKYTVYGLIVAILLTVLVWYKSYMSKQEIFQRAFESAGGENFCGEWVTVLHDGSGLTIDTNPGNIDDFYDHEALTVIKKINSALNLPDSLIEKMVGTRALDGRQTTTYEGIVVSWTYHPDCGLEILYERN